jgi:hypothetical protein
MDLILGTFEAHDTARGLSTLNKVVTLDFGGSPEFYHESLSVLVDARAPLSSSFTASSYAVATHCTDIGATCQLNGSMNSWNCPDPKFSGIITNSFVMPTAASLLLQGNVVKWPVAAKVTAGDNSFTGFTKNPNFAISERGASLFTVMRCETAVYEVENLKIGSSYIPQFITPANASVAKLIFSPAFPGRSSKHLPLMQC